MEVAAMPYKEQIVEQYIPLVKYIASRIMVGRTTYIEYEDLVSYGLIGLMDAISKFDPDKGIKFSSYASIRIKGEMIDQIRKARPISKGAMDKLAKYNEAVEKLQNELYREPTIDEISKYLGISISDVIDIEGFESEQERNNYTCYFVVNTIYGQIELGM